MVVMPPSCGVTASMMPSEPTKGVATPGRILTRSPTLNLTILCRTPNFSVSFRGLSPYLFALELLSQCTLDAFLFSGLQIIGVFLKILDNAFLLNLSFEAPKGALNRFTFENPHF